MFRFRLNLGLPLADLVYKCDFNVFTPGELFMIGDECIGLADDGRSEVNCVRGFKFVLAAQAGCLAGDLQINVNDFKVRNAHYPSMQDILVGASDGEKFSDADDREAGGIAAAGQFFYEGSGLITEGRVIVGVVDEYAGIQRQALLYSSHSERIFFSSAWGSTLFQTAFNPPR